MSRLRAHFTLDPRSLATFRIGLGALLLYHLLDRARHLEAHYTDAGVLPREALVELSARPIVSLHMLGGSVAFQALLTAISALTAACIAVGYRTRIACIAAYVLLFSVQWRNPVLVHGQDAFLLTMLLWTLFVPLDGAWSFGARRPGTTAATTAPAVCSAGTVGLALQPWMLYLVVTVSKFQYPSWTEGRAVYALLHKTHYVRPLGTLALEIPGFTAFATYATLACEVAILCLLTTPWQVQRARTVAVALNTAFHGALFCMVDVGLFQPLAILSLVPLVPPSAWNRLAWARRHVGLSPAAGDRSSRFARVRDAMCVAIVGVSIVSLPGSLRVQPVRYPEPLASVYYYLRLERRHRMFANMDATLQGWWGFAGTLHDGRVVDAVAGVARMRALPRERDRAGPDDDWQSYLSNLAAPSLRAMRPYAAEYFCRRWNVAAPPAARMVSIEMLQIRERATHPGRPTTRKRSTLLRGPCP
jgi:hypothetical protein